jgi:hypothetical protein
MAHFDDVILPAGWTEGFTMKVLKDDEMVIGDAGISFSRKRRRRLLREFEAPKENFDDETIYELYEHFAALDGGSCLWSNPRDWNTTRGKMLRQFDALDSITATDTPLLRKTDYLAWPANGQDFADLIDGDGSEDTFVFAKAYKSTVGSAINVQPVQRIEDASAISPINAKVLAAVGGVPKTEGAGAGTFSINLSVHPQEITFNDGPPGVSVAVTWGGLFYTVIEWAGNEFSEEQEEPKTNSTVLTLREKLLSFN